MPVGAIPENRRVNVKDFDETRLYLGALCRRSHDAGGGQSLRRFVSRNCEECRKEIAKTPEKLAHRRQVYQVRKLAIEYGIDYGAIIDHLGPRPSEHIHCDHVIPLAAFDLDNARHVKLAFAPENHAWLEKSANFGKRDKMPLPWEIDESLIETQREGCMTQMMKRFDKECDHCKIAES